MSQHVRIGCAGWAIDKQNAPIFPLPGTHLERYARRFNAVEINSSFHRPHKPATYARWAAAVPEGFSFSVKAPKTITHELRLRAAERPLDEFLNEVGGLADKLGPLLFQLPPKLGFEPQMAASFFAALRTRFGGNAVLEPRHPDWFAPRAQALLKEFRIACAAADPSKDGAGSFISGCMDRPACTILSIALMRSSALQGSLRKHQRIAPPGAFSITPRLALRSSTPSRCRGACGKHEWT